MSAFDAGPAADAEVNAALLLLHGRGDALSQAYRIDATRLALERGEIPRAGLVVARGAGYRRVAAAGLFQPLAGRAGAVIPAEGVPAARAAVMRRGLAWLREGGCAFAQSIVEATDRDAAETLAAAGFAPAGPVWSMAKSLARDTSPPRLDGPPTPPWAGLDFEPAEPESPPAAFAETLAATHVGSLDYPELDGLRPIADHLVALADGRTGSRWWLGRRGAVAVGVVLLADGVGPRSAELVYLGVAPAARGRRAGRSLLAFAEDRALAGGASDLELFVDSRNEPAARLYARGGFRLRQSRDVWLLRFESR